MATCLSPTKNIPSPTSDSSNKYFSSSVRVYGIVDKNGIVRFTNLKENNLNKSMLSAHGANSVRRLAAAAKTCQFLEMQIPAADAFVVEPRIPVSGARPAGRRMQPN